MIISRKKRIRYEDLEFFCPTELEPKVQCSQLITQFRLAGRSMMVSHSAVHGLVMQLYKFYKYLTVIKQLVDDEQNQQIQKAVTRS
jgi:hypothetical protein